MIYLNTTEDGKPTDYKLIVTKEYLIHTCDDKDAIVEMIEDGSIDDAKEDKFSFEIKEIQPNENIPNKFTIGNKVYHIGIEYTIEDMRKINEEWVYDLLEVNGDGILNDVKECDLVDIKTEVNKFGVPYHSYTLTLANGDTIKFDMAWEDSWGNVSNWIGVYEYVGYGNEEDGYTEIVKVIDDETGFEVDVWDFLKMCEKYTDYYSA